MNIKARIARVALRRRDTLTLEAARGALLRCLDGGVWITQDGDRTDHLVGAGSSFRVDRDGTVVVQATRAAHVAIESPREDNPAHWWSPLARGTA